MQISSVMSRKFAGRVWLVILTLSNAKGKDLGVVQSSAWVLRVAQGDKAGFRPL